MVQRPRKHPDPIGRRYGNVVAIPQGRGELPPAPEHLAPTEAALWASIVATYAMDDAASLTVLTAALECRARARQCRTQIDAEGQTVVGESGISKPHPLLAAEGHAHGAFLQCMRHLRLDVG